MSIFRHNIFLRKKREGIAARDVVRGFTLIEILFTIAFFTVLVALALPVGLDSYRHYLLTSEASAVLNFLRRAEALSLSNDHASAHGLSIQSNQYVVFQGASYASRNASFDEVYPRSSDVLITGPTEINFTAVSGNPNASSTFIFSNGAGSRSISVNEQGTINW